jgi:hypothetical protein
MSNIIDCENMFINMRMMTMVKRYLRDSDKDSEATVEFYPDESSPTGIGLVLVDRNGHSRKISNDIINNLLTKVS